MSGLKTTRSASFYKLNTPFTASELQEISSLGEIPNIEIDLPELKKDQLSPLRGFQGLLVAKDRLLPRPLGAGFKRIVHPSNGHFTKK